MSLNLYLGFMDEEVSYLLNQLIHEAAERRRVVYVIDRKLKDIEYIFEKHKSYFVSHQKTAVSGEISVQNHILATNEADLGKGRSAKLAESIRDFVNDNLNNEGSLTKKYLQALPSKTTPSEPVLHVATFVPKGADPKGTPVVLVRSPEMGLQSDLVRPYLRIVMKALKETFPGNSFNMRCFGAGGAISPKLKVGSVSKIVGSIFIGHELKREDGKLYPTVAFASPESSYKFQVRSRGYINNKEGLEDAHKAAVEAFEELGRNLRDPDKKKTLADVLISTLQESKDPHATISVTASFFIGQELKMLCNEVGRSISGRVNNPVIVSDANMEDYHVFRIMNSMKTTPAKYPGLGNWFVSRVNCDPAHIDKKFEEVFAVNKKMTLTLQDYHDLVLWGRQGVDFKKMPPATNWLHFSSEEWIKEVDTNSSYFYKFTHEGHAWIINPFAMEIAIDFEHEFMQGRKLEDALAPLKQSDGTYKVWVRKKKWEKSDVNTLDALRLDGSAIDRALYKSTNLINLAILGPKVAINWEKHATTAGSMAVGANP